MHNIIFDLGGVLLDIDMQRSLLAFEALGIDTKALLAPKQDNTPQATICEGMSATGFMHLYQIGSITTEQFLNELRTHCHPGTTQQQLLNAWNACLIDIPQFKLDAILQLRQQGYKVHMLSNTNDSHWQYIAQQLFPQPPHHYFDHIFLSQEMHLAKPDPTIYQAVLQQINAQPHDCLFIDDAQINCDAAAALGLHTYKADTAHPTAQGTLLRPATEWPSIIHQLLSTLS